MQNAEAGLCSRVWLSSCLSVLCNAWNQKNWRAIFQWTIKWYNRIWGSRCPGKLENITEIGDLIVHFILFESIYSFCFLITKLLTWYQGGWKKFYFRDSIFASHWCLSLSMGFLGFWPMVYDLQGLIAGVNAARKAQSLQLETLPRNSSYLGTLLDDLVTKVRSSEDSCGI